MMDPDVSVVVATRNRRSALLVALEHLTAEARVRPILVVDNGSTDGTADAVRAAFPDVEVLRSERNLGAAGRNWGVARAPTSYVAFSDDDSWWAPGALDRAVDAFERCPRLGLVAARVEIGPDRTVDPISVAMAASPIPPDPDLPGPPVLGFLACGTIVRRRAFLDASGFSELLFFFGEEELLAVDMAQAGWGLAYLDHVVAHHHPPPAGDPTGRRRLATRNHLLTTWMRRPAPSALAATGRVVVGARRDPAARRGVLAAVASLPPALRQRRVIDRGLNHHLRLLEAARGGA